VNLLLENNALELSKNTNLMSNKVSACDDQHQTKVDASCLFCLFELAVHEMFNLKILNFYCVQ